MIVHKSIYENKYVITDIDYELLLIISSSLLVKYNSIQSKIKHNQDLMTEYSDKKKLAQIRKELTYFKEIKKKIDNSIDIINMAIENI